VPLAIRGDALFTSGEVTPGTDALRLGAHALLVWRAARDDGTSGAHPFAIA